jgi:hypothetical protein
VWSCDPYLSTSISIPLFRKHYTLSQKENPPSPPFGVHRPSRIVLSRYCQHHDGALFHYNGPFTTTLCKIGCALGRASPGWAGPGFWSGPDWARHGRFWRYGLVRHGAPSSRHPLSCGSSSRTDPQYELSPCIVSPTHRQQMSLLSELLT